MTALEIAANTVTAASIFLAARNSVHTWWTGIIGCILFDILFWESRLYADVVLQAFFVLTSVYGWWHWIHGTAGHESPVKVTPPNALSGFAIIALIATVAYGALLHRFTNAFAPFADSAVLMFSVVAQLLLMKRRVETWPVWILVNSIAVPVYFSRGLGLTAILYAGYWLNAWFGWWTWRRERAAA
jgi:nicotinamide mononucleotide transporter